MEVHHHPKVERKNFKEYFLESLMIFLAVTMGFFAESFREHVTNKETAKISIESLVRNLEEDTAFLAQVIQFNKLKAENIDSFITTKRMKLSDTSVKKRFFYYAIKISFIHLFTSNQSTFEQMKSSGTLRLIKPNAVDSMSKYESMLETLKSDREFCLASYHETTEDTKGAYDFTAFDVLDPKHLYFDVKQTDLKANELPVITNDALLLQRLYNQVFVQRNFITNYVFFLNEQLSYARKLIPFLKKEYDIE